MDAAPPPEQLEPPRSTWWRGRWWVHVVVLGSYPLVLGLLGATRTLAPQETMLPREVDSLLLLMGATMLQFGLFLGVAWAFSRATASQMLLPWRGGVGPIWRGFLYSIVLRFAILVIGLLIILAIIVIQGADVLPNLRPSTEKLVDPQALADDPLYMVINLTVVSFVMAGFREELWRAGVMAGLWALFPKLERTVWGQAVTVSILAVIFGLGHLPQGWLGVAQTTFLGLCLGAIMVFHRSIWDAVLAHGFFNATTFLMLPLVDVLQKGLKGGGG